MFRVLGIYNFVSGLDCVCSNIQSMYIHLSIQIVVYILIFQENFKQDMKLSCKWFKCLKWTKNEEILGDTNEQKKLILKEIGSELRVTSEQIRKNDKDFSVTRPFSVSVSEPSSPRRSTKFW